MLMYHYRMSYGGSGSARSSISGATDVAFSNLQNGQALVYSATTQKWQNATVAAGASTTANVKAYGATGNGVTDDRASIQAAIDALGVAYVQTGAEQTLLIPDGIYLVGAVDYTQDNGAVYGATSLKLSNGVHITGKGTIKVKAGAYGPGAFYRCFSSHDGVGGGSRLSNASVSEITIDGNVGSFAASAQCSNMVLECAANVTIDSVKCVNSNGNAIMLRGVASALATNLKVRGCTVINCKYIGIQASQFDGLIITDNYVADATDNGIDIYGEDGSTTAAAKNFIISNNTLHRCSVGIFPETVRDGTVTGNTIESCGDGVHINRINGAPQGIVVSANTIIACGNGINVSGDTNGVILTNNYLRSYSYAGVQLGGGNVSQVLVKDNHFDGGANTPMIAVSGNQASFIRVQNNTAGTNTGTSNGVKNTAATTYACAIDAPLRFGA